MTFNDRLTRGFIAGLAAGVAMVVVNYISFLLNIVEVLYLEWAGVLIYGYRPATWGEIVVAQAGHLFFNGILGIGFAYWVTVVSSKNYLLKGWIYSMSVWFGSYAVTLLFKVHQLIPIKLDTVLSNIVSATVYGLALAYLLRLFDQKASRI